MKLTKGILAVAMMTGAAGAQDPEVTNNQSNAAAGSPQRSQPAKPTPGAPAPAVKPAVIPGAKPAAPTKQASSAAAKPVAAPAKPAAPVKAAAKPSSASAASQNNRLERVNVVRNAGDIQIEIHSRAAGAPERRQLRSPSRVVVELSRSRQA